MKFTKFGTEFEIDEVLIAEDEKEIRKKLDEYFSGKRTVFDLEVIFPDDFTGNVMREMVRIPYGETRSYGEIAESLDSSAVAVGQACGRNPVPLIVPCHRVTGKSSLGGYGYGKGVKDRLLRLEGADF
jgi:methylated-DNA-[protein]-cysteine S-methyltransferase